MGEQYILVCGGAGYIGSHMCKHLARAGYVPVTFDNLSTGHEWAVRWGPLERGDLLDRARLEEVFGKYRISSVLHFAARSIVAESANDPSPYFRTNVTGTLNLLDAMRAAGVTKLVFSSSAAVYGVPDYTPIDESHRCAPINAYGWSKLMAERQVAEYCRAYDLRAVALRYFNAAGADPESEIGESHFPETHLIPSILRASSGLHGGNVHIFGTQHDTPDGTCIRDYVHVQDLCAAHLLALRHLDTRGGFQVFNLGTGVGASVREVISMCRSLGAPVDCVEADPRPGDPPALVACFQAAEARLGWKPLLGLRECVRDALAWHEASNPATEPAADQAHIRP